MSIISADGSCPSPRAASLRGVRAAGRFLGDWGGRRPPPPPPAARFSTPLAVRARRGGQGVFPAAAGPRQARAGAARQARVCLPRTRPGAAPQASAVKKPPADGTSRAGTGRSPRVLPSAWAFARVSRGKAMEAPPGFPHHQAAEGRVGQGRQAPLGPLPLGSVWGRFACNTPRFRARPLKLPLQLPLHFPRHPFPPPGKATYGRSARESRSQLRRHHTLTCTASPEGNGEGLPPFINGQVHLLQI